MSRRLRNIILVVLPIALATGIASAASGATLPGCNNPADSALNQYCDSVPTPGGAQTPGPGGTALATTLPSQVLRQINAPDSVGQVTSRGSNASGINSPRSARQARRRLLALPAPPSRHVILGAGAAITGFSSLSVWMILVLAAVALGLAAAAITRGRQQRLRAP